MLNTQNDKCQSTNDINKLNLFINYEFFYTNKNL